MDGALSCTNRVREIGTILAGNRQLVCTVCSRAIDCLSTNHAYLQTCHATCVNAVIKLVEVAPIFTD